MYVFKDGEDEVEEDHDEDEDDEDDEDDEELHGVAFELGASCGFHVSHTHLREKEPIGAKLSATIRISSNRIPMLNFSKDCNELVGYLEDWERGRTEYPHIFGGDLK